MVESNTEKKIKENKILKIIGNIGFAVFMIIMLILILITAQSRFTGREPSLLGHRIYIVDSGSMAPTIPMDSMIIIKEVSADEIKENDIVTFYAGSSDTRVTHRVVEIIEDEKQFVTRGDANNTEDASILQGDRIIGKLAFSIPFVGTLFRFLSSIPGIVMLAVLGILFIILPKLVKKFI